jgi:large subunit ribosomal protein L32e
MMPNGLKAVVVSNLKDLELLMMHTSKYAAEIAHNVSSRVEHQVGPYPFWLLEHLPNTPSLRLRVTNAAARLRTEEA